MEATELDELERLLADARPAPWQWLDGDGDPNGDELQDGNGEFVAMGFSDDVVIDGRPLTSGGRLCAALRNAAPRLIAAARERDAAIAERDALAEDLARLQGDPGLLRDVAREVVRFYGTDRTWSLLYRELLGSRIDELAAALAASPPDPEPLDVERLAEAIAANTAIGLYRPGERGFQETIADIAAEYARLSEPAQRETPK